VLEVRRQWPHLGAVGALGLLLLFHLYIAWRIAPLLPGAAVAGALLLWLALSAALIPMAFFGRRAHRSRHAADRWSWAGMLALGAFALLLVLTAARDVLLLVAWPFASLLPPLAAPSALAVPLLAAAALLVGVFGARRIPRVRDVEVPIAGLPAALQGFTVVQLSDVHVGPTVKAPFVRGVVDRVNSLGADLVAITGDLVDGRVQDLATDVAPLAQLRSRHGSFFVTGNHEYYSGAAEWVAQLRGLGLVVLIDEHVVLDHDGARIVLAGVADHGARHYDATHRSDPHAALAGAPHDTSLRVLLAHQPRSAPAAADAGFDMQLSGHTHGGQIWPGAWFVKLQQPLVAGLHRVRSMWVYVSRGTGYWGPPLRLGAPSEITRLRFVAAP
jgi:predicted MPP superfamily phosphohydrolase